MSDRVLVTGANGHVGYTLCQHLVANGYSVRASIRNPDNAATASPLEALGCDIVGLDILDESQFVAAMDGVAGTFHVAAAYKNVPKNPELEVIRPAVVGARNAVAAAAKVGVQRLVLTSSAVAIGPGRIGELPRTEADWNDSAKLPYAIAKTRAEREAWQLAEELNVDVVSVNPPIVVGPGFHRHTESTMIFQHLIDGTFPAVPLWYASTVDARDVATGQRLAFEQADAKGRYILSHDRKTLFDLAVEACQIDKSLKLPKRTL